MQALSFLKKFLLLLNGLTAHLFLFLGIILTNWRLVFSSPYIRKKRRREKMRKDSIVYKLKATKVMADIGLAKLLAKCWRKVYLLMGVS